MTDKERQARALHKAKDKLTDALDDLAAVGVGRVGAESVRDFVVCAIIDIDSLLQKVAAQECGE